jgi:hypothetical protein
MRHYKLIPVMEPEFEKPTNVVVDVKAKELEISEVNEYER